MQFCGIFSCIHISSVVDVKTCVYQKHPDIDHTAYEFMTKYHKTACTSLPEDEHLVV